MSLNITVCTTFYKSAKQPVSPAVESARHFGFHVEVFAPDLKFTTFLKTKILPMIAYLEHCPTKLVLFVDGTDTFFTCALPKVMETYKKMADGAVVIGSERVVWPYPELADVVGSGLDTGLIMGPTDKVLETLKRVAGCVTKAQERFPWKRLAIHEDDVGLWSIAMAEGLVDPVVDRKYRLIAALRNTTDDDYQIHDDRLTIDGIEPCIIHCNGHRRIDRNRLLFLYSVLLGKRWVTYKQPTHLPR